MRRTGFTLLATLTGVASALLIAFAYADRDAGIEVRAVAPEALERTAPQATPQKAREKPLRPDERAGKRERPLRPDERAGKRERQHITMLRIPRLGLNERVTWDVDDGPAWWPVTGRPGGGDTIAIAGHRTTYTRPFYYLERLVPGDLVYVSWRGERHVYEVSGRRIYPATHGHIADARGHEVLLLSACTPRGSAEYRLVVYAHPYDDGRRAT